MGVSRATLPQSDKGRVADQSPRTRYLYFHNSIRVGIALGGWNELSKAPVTSNPVVCFRFKLHSAPECRHGGTEPRTESCSANSSSSIVRFGTFELDLQTGELRHAGQKVKLQEQPFQVLATLLEHPEKIVTREELLERAVCALAVDGLHVQHHQRKCRGNVPVRRKEREKYRHRANRSSMQLEFVPGWLATSGHP